MSRVNPLHIIVLLLVCVLFVFVELQKRKSELATEKASLIESQEIAQELLAYKKLFGDKKRVQSALEKIASQRSLQGAGLKIIQKENSLKVLGKSMNLKALNSFLSKLLNGRYIVRSLEISRIDSKHVSMEVEVGW